MWHKIGYVLGCGGAFLVGILVIALKLAILALVAYGLLLLVT